jgi:methylmalonyl-CoA mutase C-terminal domain/subunit
MKSAKKAGDRPARVLITRIGLDGHDRGSRIVAAFLRDAGMEVVYTGPWQTVASVTNLALQEDVDVVGISSLAGDHLLVPNVIKELKATGLGHVAVVVGGIVPDTDIRTLADAGVAHVFHPGSTREEIVGKIAEFASAARAQATM